MRNFSATADKLCWLLIRLRRFSRLIWYHKAMGSGKYSLRVYGIQSGTLECWWVRLGSSSFTWVLSNYFQGVFLLFRISNARCWVYSVQSLPRIGSDGGIDFMWLHWGWFTKMILRSDTAWSIWGSVQFATCTCKVTLHLLRQYWGWRWCKRNIWFPSW